MEDLKAYIDLAARAIEVTGVLTILTGIAFALLRYLLNNPATNPLSYKILRQQLGKAILLGLEILVAGDIIATVAAKPQMDHVLVLAIIVLIRTFLSLSIEVEIEGKFPWQTKVGEN